MKKQLALVAALAGLFAAGSANALLIDDFSGDFQSYYTDVFGNNMAYAYTGHVSDSAGDITFVTGTTLSNADRDVTATVSSGSGKNTSADIDSGTLILANNNTTNGTVLLTYNFDSANFLLSATAIQLQVLGADAVGVNVTLFMEDAAGDTSTSGVKSFATGDSTFYQLFSGMTNTLGTVDYDSIKKVQFLFSGNVGWDVSVDMIQTTTPPPPVTPPGVPEPATLGLLGLGLLGLGLSRRKRAA